MRNVFSYLAMVMAVIFAALALSCSFIAAQPQSSFPAPLLTAKAEEGSAQGATVDRTVPPVASLAPGESVPDQLDGLFAELRRTSNVDKSRKIAIQITRLWAQSGSATVDLLLQWANSAMLERRYASALDFLNEAIALDPEYAEAWNRRATIYFLKNDYAHAMHDFHRTLELEPRHYGALTGMATILRARGLKEQALKAYEAALAINPMMRDTQKDLNDLADEITDTRT